MVATRWPAPDPRINPFEDLVRQPERRLFRGISVGRRAPTVNTFTGRVYKKPTNLMPKFYQDRDERHRTKLVKMLEAEISFTGRSYSYKMETTASGKVGVFSVYGTDVLTINLDNGTISSVYIPLESQVLEGQHKKQLNLVRLLFRRLGLTAVRNKDFTVVETNGHIRVLEPGETWVLPILASPIVLPKKVKKEWTQLPLIPEEIYAQAEKEYYDEKTRKQIEEYQKRQRTSTIWGSSTKPLRTNRGYTTISSNTYYTGTEASTAGISSTYSAWGTTAI